MLPRLAELRACARGPRITKATTVKLLAYGGVATTFNEGSTEYKTGWAGPAVAVMVIAPKNTMFAHMHGFLVKCAIDQVRPATSQESLAAELIKESLVDSRKEMRRFHQRRCFGDISGPERRRTA